jgi:hypothetical protein
MALIKMTLPQCDLCEEVWLPEKGPARDNPRKYDAQQRAAGEPPLRCGKCKATGWDRNFTGDRRRKDPKKTSPKKLSRVQAAEVVAKKAPVKRCKHGLLHCAQCGGKT